MQDFSELADRFLIRELIDGYCNIVNRRAWSELSALFTEDAKWTLLGVSAPGVNNSWDGRDRIVRAVTRAVDRYPMLLHITGSCQVRLMGDTATASTALQEVVKADDNDGIYLLGVYYDDLLRTAEGWKFRKREFHARFINRQPMPGEVFPVHDSA